MRVVSLLPSATEIVCELGLSDQLVGVTHECDYPSQVRSLPKVTRTRIPHDATSCEIDRLVSEQFKSEKGLYSLDIPTLEQLSPELIVTQTLCDVCAVAESEVARAMSRLSGSPKVVNLEPKTLEGLFMAIQQVGEIAGVEQQAKAVVARLRARVELVEQRSQRIEKPHRVVLLEWIDPPFSSGHWSPELVRLAGGVELIGLEGQPSRRTTWEEIREADPEVMVIACCGFNLERTRKDLSILIGYEGFQEMTCFRSKRVFVIDGNTYFNRPGPRLVNSLEILAHLLDPDVHPRPIDLFEGASEVSLGRI